MTKITQMLTAKEWTKLSFTQYLQLVETVAKGFISLGLEESHSVGVMANNCVEWSTSSIATVFAGGLISGIYQTSSPDAVHHVANMADMDILIVEDFAMLKQALGPKRTIKEALPMIKTCVMINAPKDKLLEGTSSVLLL